MSGRRLVLLACAAGLWGLGCKNESPKEAQKQSISCAVSSPPDRAGPYPTTLHLHNDGGVVFYVRTGCIGLKYAISSCAGGFRDALEPVYHCACFCADSFCTGPLACGPCPSEASVAIPAGESLDVPWDALAVAEESRGTYSCVKSAAGLPGGRYRVAVRVYDDAAAAEAEAGGQSAVVDFELPAAGNVVDVPLASSRDACDSGAAPDCSGTDAHDVACSLSAGLSFEYDGGLRITGDNQSISFNIVPPSSYVYTHDLGDGVTPAQTCQVPIPRCSRDARVVTTGDFARALSDPAIAGLFGPGLPLYGSDPRVSDGPHPDPSSLRWNIPWNWDPVRLVQSRAKAAV